MPSLLVSAVDRLLDDAGSFPPARRPMPEAARAHHQAATGPHTRRVGPFLSPVSRLDALDACVASGLRGLKPKATAGLHQPFVPAPAVTAGCR